jgi:hypothetical protein
MVEEETDTLQAAEERQRGEGPEPRASAMLLAVLVEYAGERLPHDCHLTRTTAQYEYSDGSICTVSWPPLSIAVEPRGLPAVRVSFAPTPCNTDRVPAVAGILRRIGGSRWIEAAQARAPRSAVEHARRAALERELVRVDYWIDGGAVREDTGVTYFAFDDGTRVRGGQRPPYLEITFPDGFCATAEWSR